LVVIHFHHQGYRKSICTCRINAKEMGHQGSPIVHCRQVLLFNFAGPVDVFFGVFNGIAFDLGGFDTGVDVEFSFLGTVAVFERAEGWVGTFLTGGILGAALVLVLVCCGSFFAVDVLATVLEGFGGAVRLLVDDFDAPVGFFDAFTGFKGVCVVRGGLALACVVGTGFGADVVAGVGAADAFGFFTVVATPAIRGGAFAAGVFVNTVLGTGLADDILFPCRAWPGPVAADEAFRGPSFGTEPFVEVESTDATAVEASLDSVTTVPYRLFSSVFKSSQKLPLPLPLEIGAVLLFSAASRSCQNVPFCFLPAVDLGPDTTDPCRLFSSASSFDQKVPLLTDAPLVMRLTPFGAKLELFTSVIRPRCLLASSSASCCMKFCCLFVMLSVTIPCGSDRNC